jgi:hypothetical protein
MQFVSVLTMKPGFSRDEIAARRMEYVYPHHVEVIAEYWLPLLDPLVVIVIESEGIGQLCEALSPWYECFDVNVVPAMTAEQGLQFAKERLELAVA